MKFVSGFKRDQHTVPIVFLCQKSITDRKSSYQIQYEYIKKLFAGELVCRNSHAKCTKHSQKRYYIKYIDRFQI